MRGIKVILALLLTVTLIACKTEEPAKSKTENTTPLMSFNPETLRIPDQGGRKLKGQVLYMPIYSNIPSNQKQPLNINALLAIHNTDLKHDITITKVDFLIWKADYERASWQMNKSSNRWPPLFLQFPGKIRAEQTSILLLNGWPGSRSTLP